MEIAYEVMAEGLLFPEGPVALADGSVLVCEIARGTLSRVQADGRVSVVASPGGGPNGAAIGPDGLCYVCNNGGVQWHEQDGLLFPGDAAKDYSGGRIERIDIASGHIECLYSECDGRPLRGPNDLVFDAAGGFWFTDTGKVRGREMDRAGVLYASTGGRDIREVLFPWDMTNGVALSPDGMTLYFSETLRGRAWRCPLTGPGRPARLPLPFDPDFLLYAAPGLAGFDSMAVEAGGNICQATLFDGGISVISPAGQRLEFLSLPDPLVTNICFGGEDMRTAYVTLSGTGRLLRMRWPRPGLALHGG